MPGDPGSGEKIARVKSSVDFRNDQQFVFFSGAVGARPDQMARYLCDRTACIVGALAQPSNRSCTLIAPDNAQRMQLLTNTRYRLISNCLARPATWSQRQNQWPLKNNAPRTHTRFYYGDKDAGQRQQPYNVMCRFLFYIFFFFSRDKKLELKIYSW